MNNKNTYFILIFIIIVTILALNACANGRGKLPIIADTEPVPVSEKTTAEGPAPVSEPKPPAIPLAVPVAEPSAEPERVPLNVQSYIHVEKLKGKPKGLIALPSEGWVNETNEIPFKGSQKLYLLKKNGTSFEPVKVTFETKDINYGALIIELEPGEYKIDKIDTKLFNPNCNCYEGYRLNFNNTNFIVENKIAKITPYALTTLTFTDNPKNNKTFLSHTNNKFKYNIKLYLENLLLKKNYTKNWKIM